MIARETIDRLNDLSDAAEAVLNAYREDIGDIYDIEIAADILPSRWFVENITERGRIWLVAIRKACLAAECRADSIEAKKEDGKEEEYSRKRVLLAIATPLLDLSNALVAALKELEAEKEGAEE
nr:MAG TPA: hypothetical protein [Caudoviricetes sp.]